MSIDELSLQPEAEEITQADSLLEPCDCANAENYRQVMTEENPTSYQLQVYAMTLDAILKAQQQLLSHPDALLDEQFTAQAAACRVPATCPPGFQGRYTVVRGDTMFLIAQRFGVSLQSLINANPHIPNPSQIFPCDVLCVPGTVPPTTCRVPATCPPGFQGRYTVQSGDTMFLIAQRFGVSLQSLINANPHIPNPNQIFPCDVLCVPGTVPPTTCRVPATCPPGFQGRYTVQSGDTMFLIAQRFGVTLQALINANPHIPNPNQIFPCDVLCVPSTVPPTCRVPATCPAGFQGRYTVRSGDTMFLIAQRCGVTLQSLINANPHIPNPNQIFPCDVLCVPPQCAG